MQRLLFQHHPPYLVRLIPHLHSFHLPFEQHKYFSISLATDITPNLFDDMPQRILILLFPLLVLLFHSSSAFIAIDPYYLNCSRPFRCSGTDINVSFPFRLPDSPSYCGIPGYELHCSGDAKSELSFNLNGTDYRVKDIDYTDGFLTLVDSDFLGNSCPQTFTNTSINPTLFDFTDIDSSVTVYINCNFPIPGLALGLVEILCLNDLTGLHSYYKYEKGPPSFVIEWLGVCELAAAVPVYETAAMSLNSSSAKFGEALQQGFGLKWSAGKEWCKGCTDSGGVCGYNSTMASDHICFCSNYTALGSCSNERRIARSKTKTWIIVTTATILFLLIILICILMIKRWTHRVSFLNLVDEIMHKLEADKEGSSKISLYQFTQLASAANNFSITNKLGEGGFGPVYKGELLDGQVVAIKRLSGGSRQGLEELKNEIFLIAKLQHKNLVRLLGYCIHREEKMLIYEFMPNKSLDLWLFNVEQGSKLAWTRRFEIIEGIAQGLLYLHKYSRLKVIHRDLKTSNILLDFDMNPKISDFGIARIFDSNVTQANTRRIVGTYGYMSPEYAFNGLFSVKSDVFSFGVLLLEIVSGKRNASSHEFDSSYNLLSYAWNLWKDGTWIKLVDPALNNQFQHDEVARCIYVALQCVQESLDDRPVMSDVVIMLSNENLYFNHIKQPAFFTTKNASDSKLPLNLHVNSSSNGLSLSTMGGR